MSFFDWLFRKRCRVIVIEDGILTSLQPNLHELMEMWRREGAQRIFVFLYPKGAGGSPVPIRQFLKKLSKKYHLEGVMFVGDLPVAFFDETYASRHIVYTSDYFFMELNGTWSIGNANIVSTPSKQPPKISAGRIFIGDDTGISSTRPPVSVYYNRTIKKMIRYRLRGGALQSDSKAAVVSNLGGVDAYKDHLANIYSTAVIDTYDGVTDTEYQSVIEMDYAWILYYGHSDSGGHSMAEGTIWNPFDYHEAHILTDIFQFESCATGQIAWHTNSDPYDPSSPQIAKALSDTFVSNILGNPSGGILVLAPSIPGFFDNMDRFYSYLQSGDTFGEAFRRWMIAEIAENDPHYMSLYGDPFLKLRVNPSLYRKKRSWWERLLDFFLGRGIQYV